MEQKIKRIERLLGGWEAAEYESKLRGISSEELFRRGGIDALEAAIRILKEPSNTQMHTGASWVCGKCGSLNLKRNENCGFCGERR